MSDISIVVLSFLVGLLLAIVASFRGWSWKPWGLIFGGVVVYAILVYVLSSIHHPSIIDNLAGAMVYNYPGKPVILIITYLLMDMVFPVTDVAILIMAIVGHGSKVGLAAQTPK